MVVTLAVAVMVHDETEHLQLRERFKSRQRRRGLVLEMLIMADRWRGFLGLQSLVYRKFGVHIEIPSKKDKVRLRMCRMGNEKEAYQFQSNSQLLMLYFR